MGEPEVIVLDTCAFIWDALQHSRLTPKARHAISLAEQQRNLMVCDITLWEVAMLVRKKRLQLELDPATFCQLAIQAKNIEVIPINPVIAELSVNFNDTMNHDPADRLIAATTITMEAALVTADQNLRDCPLVQTVW